MQSKGVSILFVRIEVTKTSVVVAMLIIILRLGVRGITSRVVCDGLRSLRSFHIFSEIVGYYF